MDLYHRSSALLEIIANSLHDRGQSVNFSINEIHLVEKFLTEWLEELTGDIEKKLLY